MITSPRVLVADNNVIGIAGSYLEPCIDRHGHCTVPNNGNVGYVPDVPAVVDVVHVGSRVYKSCVNLTGGWRVRKEQLQLRGAGVVCWVLTTCLLGAEYRPRGWGAAAECLPICVLCDVADPPLETAADGDGDQGTLNRTSKTSSVACTLAPCFPESLMRHASAYFFPAVDACQNALLQQTGFK